jgi:hypothetical protein
LFFGPTACHCAFVQFGQYRCHNDRTTPFAQGQGPQNFPLVAAGALPPKENAWAGQSGRNRDAAKRRLRNGIRSKVSRIPMRDFETGKGCRKRLLEVIHE